MQQNVHFPRAATTTNIINAYVTLVDARKHQAAAALIIAWAAAARVGDVMRLRPADVQINNEGMTRILFREGKGVGQRVQPFTVHTTIGPGRGIITKTTNEAKKNMQTYIFNTESRPSITKQLRRALRAQNPLLELRSIRRGALQTLALHGTPLDVVQQFSGHRIPETLLRYLGWGWCRSGKVTQTAAQCLWHQ
jgi:integrase